MELCLCNLPSSNEPVKVNGVARTHKDISGFNRTESLTPEKTDQQSKIIMVRSLCERFESLQLSLCDYSVKKNPTSICRH